MESDRAVDEARSRLALDDYASDLNRLRNSQQEAKEAVQPYNDAISGIAEPIGASGLGALAKKYLEKAVKKGVNKAVGRLQDGARSTLEEVRNGGDPLEALRNGARRTVDNIRGDITETTGDLEGNLSARGQQILNGARRLAGRSPLRPSATIDDRPPPTTSYTEESNPAPTLQQASETPAQPTAGEPRVVNLAEEDAGADEDLVNSVVNGRMDIGEALLRKSARSVPVPSARNPPPGPGDNTPPASSQPSDGGNLNTGFREGDGPQAPNQPANAEAQQSRMRGRLQELGNEPSGTESSDASLPSSNTPTSESSLLTDAGEAELEGGGPEDPIADIVAGILSLGAIITGATAKVKPADVNTSLVNPSVQYGI